MKEQIQLTHIKAPVCLSLSSQRRFLGQICIIQDKDTVLTMVLYIQAIKSHLPLCLWVVNVGVSAGEHSPL